MFRLWCVILPTVSSLYFASASTDWDVAVASTKFIDLIKHDGSENPVERIPFNENILQALAFNPIERQLYFSDSNDTENCIFRMNVETKKIQPLVTKVNGNCNIKDITYDTVTNTLYWLSDSEIRYLNLNNQKSPQAGTVFIAVDKSKEKLSCLSIDICNKKLYWISVNPTNNIDYVQNSDLDGKNKVVLTTVSDKHLPLSIQVDQNTGRVYWMEESKVNSFMYIKSLSPFDDNKVVDIHLSEAKGHQPISFTLYDSKFFWVDSTNNAIYVAEKRSNDISSSRLPIKYNSKSEQLRSIASVNYLDLAQCNKSKNQNNRVPTDIEKQSEGVHVPTKVNVEAKESENTLLCLNDGKKFFGRCVCEDGFTGAHCEISLCYNFCLNDKLCTIENNKPKCHCDDDFHGERCDKPVIKVPPKDSPSNCSCPELVTCKNVSDDLTNSTSITLLSASFNKDNVSLMKGSMENPDCNTNLWLMLVIGILAVLCILLMMLSAILMSKVLSLRKRPRIKKRIIVNKNTTPLTARPQATEQCEITIENCCNMNICETERNDGPDILDARRW